MLPASFVYFYRYFLPFLIMLFIYIYFFFVIILYEGLCIDVIILKIQKTK